MSRLSALLAFAVVANNTSVEVLGVFALISAVASAAFALGPALVAKPLAAADDLEERERLTPAAVAGAVGVAIAAAVMFGAIALLTEGLVRLALSGAALAALGALTIEAIYWATVFTEGAKRAALIVTAAYALQAIGTLALAPLGLGETIIFAPAGMVGLAAAIALLYRMPSAGAARDWYTMYRGRWLPYVGGTAASIGMVQAIPLILTATVGLGGASVFRALELSFGPTNLAAMVTSNAVLARADRRGLRASYGRAALIISAVALANGVILAFVPSHLLSVVLGSAADPLTNVVAEATLYRTAYAVSVIGVVAIVPFYLARTVGLINVCAVVTTLTLLALGLIIGGLSGGFLALGLSEFAYAVVYGVLLRRRDATTD